MSFTDTITEELAVIPFGKNCCRKALLCGLFYDAKAEPEEGSLSVFFRSESGARLACTLLSARYSVTAAYTRTVRAGRAYFCVQTVCPALRQAIDAIDSADERHLFEILGFRCGNCRSEFLRGVFIACATVNDPHKGYHLEFSLSSATRADRLCDLLATATEPPRRIVRGKRVGLYYKTNSAIADLIYYVGGTKSSFDVANTWVERDIRNNENRATNCVARNISRAVGASQKHIAAIERLTVAGKLTSLPQELQETAKLRMEYDSASLKELAAMHNPPITKSGLNGRLQKLLQAADDLESRKEEEAT